MSSPDPERPRVPPNETPPAEGSTSAGISTPSRAGRGDRYRSP
ncbi:hypothetical protein [Streptomyces bauhiniae]